LRRKRRKIESLSVLSAAVAFGSSWWGVLLPSSVPRPLIPADSSNASPPTPASLSATMQCRFTAATAISASIGEYPITRLLRNSRVHRILKDINEAMRSDRGASPAQRRGAAAMSDLGRTRPYRFASRARGLPSHRGPAQPAGQDVHRAQGAVLRELSRALDAEANPCRAGWAKTGTSA